MNKESLIKWLIPVAWGIIKQFVEYDLSEAIYKKAEQLAEAENLTGEEKKTKLIDYIYSHPDIFISSAAVHLSRFILNLVIEAAAAKIAIANGRSAFKVIYK